MFALLSTFFSPHLPTLQCLIPPIAFYRPPPQQLPCLYCSHSLQPNHYSRGWLSPQSCSPDSCSPELGRRHLPPHCRQGASSPPQGGHGTATAASPRGTRTHGDTLTSQRGTADCLELTIWGKHLKRDRLPSTRISSPLHPQLLLHQSPHAADGAGPWCQAAVVLLSILVQPGGDAPYPISYQGALIICLFSAKPSPWTDMQSCSPFCKQADPCHQGMASGKQDHSSHYLSQPKLPRVCTQWCKSQPSWKWQKSVFNCINMCCSSAITVLNSLSLELTTHTHLAAPIQWQHWTAAVRAQFYEKCF